MMRKIINFNQNWNFVKDCATLEVEGKECVAVNLPHSWNAIDGQDGGNDYFRGSCLYQKSFSKSEVLENAKCFIEINGANSSADLYLNGVKLAHHDGGYSTFRANITALLAEENTIILLGALI